MKRRVVAGMRALIATAVGMSAFAFPLSVNAGKMDLPLSMVTSGSSHGKAMFSAHAKSTGSSAFVELLIKSDDRQATMEAVGDAGGRVRSVTGDIMTAHLPIEALAGIEARSEVTAMEASKRLRPLMDTARSSANSDVEAVQGAGYDGLNVVVGVIDTGLDFSRADFIDWQGRTRVQYLRFQSVSSSGVFSVTECAKDYIQSGACPIEADNDAEQSHGTHVTGIAAGSDSTYTGVAPAADIMFVRNDFYDDIHESGADSGTFSGGLIDGVVEIFKKSDIIDKPAVVNISLGTHIGAHDNTSLLEQSLNSAVEGEYDDRGRDYGRVIVAAAGNEHVVSEALDNMGLGVFAGGIHARVNVPDGESHAYRLWVLKADGLDSAYLAIDAWFGSGKRNNCIVAANAYRYSDIFGPSFGIPPAVPSTDSAKAAIPDTALSAKSEAEAGDAVATIALATDPSDVNNSKPRALILYGPSQGSSWSEMSYEEAGEESYFLDVIVRAEKSSCTGDIWVEGGGTFVHFMGGITGGAYDVGAGSKGGAYSMRSGDNDSSVSIPGTASGVITAGAFLQTKPVDGCSESCWTDRVGVRHDATNIDDPDSDAAQIFGGVPQERSPFSSVGPPAYPYAGRKPDLLAPGDPIISTLASGFAPSNALRVATPHYKSQGTSQAAPHIAGIAALILQKNNTLTAGEVKTALISTASKADSHNNRDGHGNVRAPQAIATVAADTSGYRGRGDLSQSDLNGGGGGRVCFHSIAPVAAPHRFMPAVFVLAAAVVIAARRSRSAPAAN